VTSKIFSILALLFLVTWLWISNAAWVNDVRTHKAKIQELESQIQKLKRDNALYQDGGSPLICVNSLRDLLIYYAGIQSPEICVKSGTWIENAATKTGVSYVVIKAAFDSDNAGFLTVDQRQRFVDWAANHSCEP